MELKEAIKELEQVENDLAKLENDRIIIFGRTQPQAVDTTKELIRGGETQDKFGRYVISLEEQDLYNKLSQGYARRQNIENWITNELETLKQYSELEQLVRYYKEDIIITDKYTQKKRGLTWEEIGIEVHYSPVYCRKIYKSYKEKRNS